MKHPSFPPELVSELPLSHILLNVCTKEDLLELCRDYVIPYRRSMNKKQLAWAVEDLLTVEPGRLAECLPRHELKQLQKIVRAGGMLRSAEPLDVFTLEMQQLVVVYQERSTIWGDRQDQEYSYAIAANLQKVLKPVMDGWFSDAVLNRKSQNERLLIGFLRLYGVVSENKLRELWEAMLGSCPGHDELMELFLYRIDLKSEFKLCFSGNTLLFASEVVDDPATFYEEIRKRSDLEYATFSKELIQSFSYSALNATSIGTVARLIDCLSKKNEGDEALTAFQMGQLWESIQLGENHGSLISILSASLEFDSMEEINEIISLVTEFSNHTPHWLLKGHTPEELYAAHPLDLHDASFRKNIEEQFLQRYPDADPKDLWSMVDAEDSVKAETAPKVGRNELCPCGSGKKYKKCCGAGGS